MTDQLLLDLDGNLDAKFRSGYDTGLNWRHNWMPGGPHVYRGNAQSQAEYDYWHIGLRAGLEENFAANPDFAKWFDSNRHGAYTTYNKS